jgi:hypothetical protein
VLLGWENLSERHVRGSDHHHQYDDVDHDQYHHHEHDPATLST